MKLKTLFLALSVFALASYSVAQVDSVVPKQSVSIDVTATTHTDSAVIEVAHELGVQINPQATETEIVQKVVNAYQFIPNKDTNAGGWTKFILMLAGLIGTVVYYILHKVQKKKHDALLLAKK